MSTPGTAWRTSERAITLLDQTPDDVVPLVTLEDYPEWEGIYLLYPDNRVERIPGDVLVEVQGTNEWIDGHVFHPELMSQLATRYNGVVTHRTMVCVMIRWNARTFSNAINHLRKKMS